MSVLHPQVQAVMVAIARMNLAPPHTMPVDHARAQFMRGRALYPAPAPAVASAEDRTIPGAAGLIPIRVYRPVGSAPGSALPALVFFHGGGWVFGDLESHDSLCREACNLAGCAVVSVAYRVAPEDKFPAAVEDAVTAIRY